MHETLNDRMAATVWIFESGDFFILCDSDITFSDESGPAGNIIINIYNFLVFTNQKIRVNHLFVYPQYKYVTSCEIKTYNLLNFSVNHQVKYWYPRIHVTN